MLRRHSTELQRGTVTGLKRMATALLLGYIHSFIFLTSGTGCAAYAEGDRTSPRSEQSLENTNKCIGTAATEILFLSAVKSCVYPPTNMVGYRY